MNRYAAKVLFQFRFENEPVKTFRQVERRIVVFPANDASDGYAKALNYGKKSEFIFTNNDGLTANFEFIGVEDFMHLGDEADENEVWYEVGKMLNPMERKKVLIPPKNKFSAFKLEK